jgi:AcrR family transcriptional regulator
MTDSPTAVLDDAPLAPRAVELVRCTYRVMARQGSHRLSLQDIAEEAGVSKGLLLYHFKTKDNLLLATMRWALTRTAHRIRERTASTPDARAALGAVVDAVFVGAKPNHDFHLFYLDLLEHAVRVDAYQELPALMRDIINRLYAEVIQRGIDEGVFDVTDAQTAATVMRAQIDGIFLQWMQTDDWETNHADYRDLCHTSLERRLGAA